MDFDTLLSNYAELIAAHGLNVQPGQIVYLSGEHFHRDLLQKVAKAAYKRGALYVGVDFSDPLLTKLRLTDTQNPEGIKYVPPFITKKFNDIVDENAALLRILGSEYPDALEGIPAEKLNTMQLSYREGIRRFYDDGIGRDKVQWNLAAAATPNWAKKIFPDLPEKEAYDALWKNIFAICRVDKPNFLELWKEHNATLHKRAEKLTQMKIKELHFIGPGTDLHVYLTPKAIFRGGGGETASGTAYEPNIPTEECFTTPDCRLTEGKVRTTRPYLVHGVLVEGLELEFKNGEIVNFSARKGQETFTAYISSDEGAKRLGEVALVGIDSPVYQSGLVFRETLFDENAACHIAIGSAYKYCIDGGTKMQADELNAIGCNISNVHSDMMISSEEVDVVAHTYNGETIQLITKGKWN